MTGHLMILPPQSARALEVAKAAKLRKGLYAALPGTGPAGETCGSCEHIVRTRRYRKCELVATKWTHGAATDIKARSPACSKWEAA